MKPEDVEDIGNRFLVNVSGDNKNYYSGQFLIGEHFYARVKRYISLRPPGYVCDKFFLNYQKGKCTMQPIGIHKIGKVPSTVAAYCDLDEPMRYTGHCLRRTSATLLSDSGANMQAVMQLGRWRSDMVARGYIENSLANREMIYQGIIHNQNKPSKAVNTNCGGNAITSSKYNQILQLIL